MEKKLFLLDGMALVYRAHFALIARPILTSKGVNTSALYGFTQTLLEIINNQKPTHIAVAFDTEAATQRHAEFAEYKATRQAMPEDLSAALPNVRRMLDAFRIPVLTCDGYEADDLIATLVKRAVKDGFTSFMVTPDKDFGQVVGPGIFLYKPGRMGDPAEILGAAEICARWGIERPEQVIDILALMGDSIDNVPGVPGVGEKTAAKLIAKFGSVESLLARTEEITSKLRQTIESHRDLALLSKRLVTLNCNTPCDVSLETLRLVERDDEKLKPLLVEFEFNSIGRRLYGDDFKAGRGFQPPNKAVTGELGLFDAPAPSPVAAAGPPKAFSEAPHQYTTLATADEAKALAAELARSPHFGVAAATSGPDPKQGRLLGMAFAAESGKAAFVAWPASLEGSAMDTLLPLLTDPKLEKTGHDLKTVASFLKWNGRDLAGRLFDTMVAHSLIEPDMRHSLEYVSEVFLSFTPARIPQEAAEIPQQMRVQLACERADLALRLRARLEPMLREKAQERVFYEIEAPLIPVLADMEFEGIRVDAGALQEFAIKLGKEIDEQERSICRLAGSTFNLNSPRQLGQVLFDVMKICEPPKKTKTGQYATDEQTLAALAPDHEIVRRLLEHRAATKLKSTYADALPTSIWPATGRVHTTYHQVSTSTGRLNSQNPNLQNIPIRTDRGQEIRKAFVPRSADHLLLSADYSQIELRVIAALSKEAGLLEAFRTGTDVHTATAARVYGVALDAVTPEMRRKAKMVNYGIAYGISAFGLAQRLAIPRKESSEIIDQYFRQFAGIRRYMDQTIQFARDNSYVETVTGRRRYIRDINSSNGTVRAGAERNAINAPIQGSAADMIKLAMVKIHGELQTHGLRTKMLLQVHDELVFDLYRPEQEQVMPLVEHCMRTAIALEVPIEVDMGVGEDWLEAH